MSVSTIQILQQSRSLVQCQMQLHSEGLQNNL